MYIRTKDGIYETRENGETYNGFGCKFNNGTIKIHKKDILKQSETLEELCDEIVYCKRGFYEIYRQLDFAHYDKEYIKNGGTIKGAIWTDKGLIYVAKMDNEGKLVLI